MKQKTVARDIWLLTIIFAGSRILLHLSGVKMDFGALFRYWQYLDVETLKNNLLKGVWYDHTQPPFFNIFLGVVLKISGLWAEQAFILIFKLLSLANAIFLFALVKKTTKHTILPFFFSLLYMLSPATMVFENELFYTTFITFLLLTSTYFLLKMQNQISLKNATGFFLPLVAICLTRSMYHLAWLLVITVAAGFYLRKQKGYSIYIALCALSIVFTSGWYIKNKVIFDTFSTSSWMGMNVARNVFHDAVLTDSTKIEAIEPFSKVSIYQPFLSINNEKYKGLNDRDLFSEYKNDSFINEKHINYLEVSQKYMDASKKQVKKYPLAYLKNVVQSSIIFFAPGTRYPSTEYQSSKIKYYDILYSFNLTHFATGKQERRIAMVVSALPKIIFYLTIFFFIFRFSIRQNKIILIHAFITLNILYIFFISSFFEHYENMRFRYEAEPLFLILAAYVIDIYLCRNKQPRITI